MPVLSAKTQSAGFEALAAKVEAKKRGEREKEAANELLKTFSVKSSDKEKEKSLNDADSGTLPVVNSAEFGNRDTKANNNLNVSLKTAEDNKKPIETKAEIEKTESERKSERSISITSGSPKIQELQEIQKQLNKSYAPKPLFQPRRPTLESIKSAIEKAKQDEASRNKSVGTDEHDVSIATIFKSDASTSVDRFFKRKKKKKKTSDSVSADSTGTSSSTSKAKKESTTTKSTIQKNKKKIVVGVKVKAKIDKPKVTPPKPNVSKIVAGRMDKSKVDASKVQKPKVDKSRTQPQKVHKTGTVDPGAVGRAAAIIEDSSTMSDS